MKGSKFLNKIPHSVESGRYRNITDQNPSPAGVTFSPDSSDPVRVQKGESISMTCVYSSMVDCTGCDPYPHFLLDGETIPGNKSYPSQTMIQTNWHKLLEFEESLVHLQILESLPNSLIRWGCCVWRGRDLLHDLQHVFWGWGRVLLRGVQGVVHWIHHLPNVW